MSLENGFKIREINGKKWSRNSDLQDEISVFSDDDFYIDKNENNVLGKILDYNKRKHKEKLLIQNTSREQLEYLAQIPGLKFENLEKINKILEKGTQYVGDTYNDLEYEQISRGYETNVIFKDYHDLKNEATKLGKNKIKKLQKIIGAKADGKFGQNTFRRYKKYNENWQNEGIEIFLIENIYETNLGNYYNINSTLETATKRTKTNIESLSNEYNFKNNVISFYNELFNLGYKIEIIEGKRSLAQQKEKIKKGWSKTIHSAHVKGLAIDILYNKKDKIPLKIKQIAAKYGLINGYEMWGWDSGHFQAYYQGDLSKREERFVKMKNRGTLPEGYLV